MQEKVYTIYIHQNIANKKVYIGMTKIIPKVRWANGKGYKNNKFFNEDILKYGWENFIHKILYENLTKEEAEQKEIELIALYNATDEKYGYNLENGGTSKNKTTDKIKKKISTGLIKAHNKSNIKNDSTMTHISMDKNFINCLKKKAKEKGLSLSSYIRMLLMEKMQNEK